MDSRRAIAFLLVLGCGDESSGPADAAVDAYVNALGRACNALATCPTGFECISVDGSTRTFCSMTCAGASDKRCGTGYGGPGKALCAIDRGASAEPTHCGVVCNDPGNDVCGATTCDGMCPESLQCGADTGAGFALCQ